MDVLGNNSPLKDSEGGSTSRAASTVVPNSNFSCRLPRAGGTERHKNEADIELLVACKMQLSSEVIRWKTESLRLQKERDTAIQRTKVLDHTLVKLAEHTKELESRLALAENEHTLKPTASSYPILADVCASRLAHSSLKFQNYHSFPWSRNTDKIGLNSDKRLSASCWESSASKGEQQEAEEDWRQVSEKMMEQMREEMREMRDMRCCFFSRSDQGPSMPETKGREDSELEELEQLLLSAMSETQSLKHCLLNQRRKLETLLESCDSGYIEIKRRDSDSTSTDASSIPSKCHSHLSGNGKTSEEKYREHYSRKLGKSSNLNKIAKKVKHILKSPELNLKPNITIVPDSTSVCTPPQEHPLISNEVAKAPEEESDKVCPICQMTFSPSQVTQIEFEEHVMNHLETESASLLDQYVVV